MSEPIFPADLPTHNEDGYTEQEEYDLKALRVYRNGAKKLVRSGHPRKRAIGKARRIVIEFEVRKIHRRAEKRARIAERMASR